MMKKTAVFIFLAITFNVYSQNALITSIGSRNTVSLSDKWQYIRRIPAVVLQRTSSNDEALARQFCGTLAVDTKRLPFVATKQSPLAGRLEQQRALRPQSQKEKAFYVLKAYYDEIAKKENGFSKAGKPNHPAFLNVVLLPEEKYDQTTIFRF